ncbi:MAG TPA: DUF1189 family protein [Candidatus Saccharimonadales bacterium]|nr:DUF1189 family protein [Candidatus Saccharimonadales bacterium]
MDFLENIKNSVYNPNFYRNIPKESFNSALKYYLLLCLLVTFFRLVFLSFPIATSINMAVKTGTQGLLETYPANLEITIHKGQLAINQPQPYILPLCSQTDHCVDIVIDTKKPDVDNYLKQKNLFMLLTKDTVYIKSSEENTRVSSLSRIRDLTLNKSVIMDFIRHISPWTKFFIPLAILFIGVILYIGFLFKLIYLLILAVILWLLAKKFAPGLSYGQSYKVSLHVVTLGILIALFLDVTSWFFHIYSYPFTGTIFSILIFIINFNTPGTKTIKKASRTTKKK